VRGRPVLQDRLLASLGEHTVMHHALTFCTKHISIRKHWLHGGRTSWKTLPSAQFNEQPIPNEHTAGVFSIRLAVHCFTGVLSARITATRMKLPAWVNLGVHESC